MQQRDTSPQVGDSPGYALPSGSPSSSDAPPYLLAGEVLAGRYRVRDLVGEGKHGTVYSAEALPTGHRVAIKCLAPEQGSREATFLGTLEHPLLPALLEYFSEETTTYLVMEWVEGQPLWRWSSDARGSRTVLPLPDVFRIGFQLSEVFAYLHGLVPPVWFQDLHEGNVLRQPDGRIKLLDFGRARRLAPGEEAERHFDISDSRHLLFRLLPPELPNELQWRVRGMHPSLQPEDAWDLRAALEALLQELGLAAP